MRQFSAEHVAVLALTAIAIAVAIRAPRALPPRALAVLIGGPWPHYIAAAAVLALGLFALLNLLARQTRPA